jgi:hypothetical protein
MRKEDKLRVKWSRKENEIKFYFPSGAGTKCDASYLCSLLGPQFIDEMTARNYDITTLKFSIEPMQGSERFASQRKARR